MNPNTATNTSIYANLSNVKQRRTSLNNPNPAHGGLLTAAIELQVTIDAIAAALIEAGTVLAQHGNGNNLLHFPADSNACVAASEPGSLAPAKPPKRAARGKKTSRFRGVRKRKDRFDAAHTYKKKYRHLGTFDTEEEAAMAYDRNVILTFGTGKAALRKLNFPLPHYLKTSGQQETGAA